MLFLNRQTPDKVIPMCRYPSHATQKLLDSLLPQANDCFTVVRGRTFDKEGAGTFWK